ncbi:uncharacterized protein LOC135373684 [Ornithodoros turicata]|uniref:uncharacterized protein LOC135373684 n=1 Tax=Ornithodoros turicata TaxID=34597 RepID=UPI003139A5AA
MTHEAERDSCQDCEELKRQLKGAEEGQKANAEERDQLRRKLEDSEEKYELGRMLRLMKKIVSQIEQLLPNPTAEASKVDIGYGVLVEATTLARIESQCANTANTYARVLLSNVFGRENLIGKSLYGVQSNANKGSDAKPPLDREKLDAVLGYTCQKFRQPVGPIKNSLAAMLSKLSRPQN